MDNAGARFDDVIEDLCSKQKDATAAALQEAAADELADSDEHEEPWNAKWQTKCSKGASRSPAKKPPRSAAEKHT